MSEASSQVLMLRKPAVCRMLGISAATLDRLRARGDFPPPRRISNQVICWPRSAIEEWLEQQPQAVQ